MSTEVRSQESLDAAERVMAWYLKASHSEAFSMLCRQRAALETALSAIENLDFAAWEQSGQDSAAYRVFAGVPSLAEAASVIRAVLGR